MARIVVQNAVKKFGSFVAVNNVSLTVEDEEFVVLLGPSGCGKTTLLRAIAGLGIVDSGTIKIGERDVTYLAPRDRQISMVFQSYAIFPHMKVFDNIAFGLKMNKVPKQQIKERVQRAAEMLHIEDYLDRHPGQMSGELKFLLKKLGTTTIYVTHDQIEALSMGDRIAVMRNGEILQCDHPTRVYDMPTDRFVGGFIGNPPMNFIEAQVQKSGDRVTVKVNDFEIEPVKDIMPSLAPYEGENVVVGIRAENMEALSQPAENALKVNVHVVEPLGSQNLLTIPVGDTRIKVSTHPTFPAAPGDDIWIRFPGDKIRWIDRKTGKAIAPDIAEVVGDGVPSLNTAS